MFLLFESVFPSLTFKKIRGDDVCFFVKELGLKILNHFIRSNFGHMVIVKK